MRKILQRFPVFLLILIVCSFIFSHPAQAEDVNILSADWWASIFSVKKAVQTDAEAGSLPNSTTGTWNSWKSSLTYTFASIAGGDALADTTGVTGDAKLEMEKQIGPGAIGDLRQGIVALYDPPASSKTYVADLIHSAHLVPQAQAQGLGFVSLDPILSTWKQFRNVAYMFFVVIFIVIGFMIMFRTKVGQAAITAQQAIPNIIVALLAVTFSYAIAGLLIDLMYLLLYMIVGVMNGDPSIVSKNFFGLVGEIMADNAWSNSQQAIQGMMDSLLNMGAFGAVTAWLTSLAGATIVGIAILIATFKIFFELLKTYVVIIIQVVFSPLILMTGALPGKNTFANWIKGLVGNLLMWPVVLICLLLEKMLTAPLLAAGEVNQTGGFMPPFLVGNGQSEAIPVAIGVGILLVIPEIMKQVKKMMGVDEGIFGSLAGEAWGNVKQGLPLGGRLSSIGAGAAAGAGKVVLNLPSALRGSPDAAFAHLRSGVLKTALKTTEGGFRATHGLSKSIGANQPDALNIVTNSLDDVFGNEEIRNENSLLQLSEDVNDRIRSRRAGPTLIPKSWTQKMNEKKK